MSKTSSLTITLNSQNVANNTSNITVKGIIKCDSGSYRTNKTLTYWVKANGSYVSNSMPVSTTASAKASTTNTMFTWTGNVSHNSSGKCTVTAHFNFYSGWVEEDASKTLTAIPQSATLTSVTNTVAGGTCTCKFTPKSTVYKYKITFSCGGVTVTSPEITPSSTSETTYYFDMPVDTWHPAIPNSKTGTVTATLKTYNGSTQIGSSSSKTFTLTANSSSSYLPSISSVSYIINNDYDGNYLQNKSSVTVTPSASMGSEPSDPSNRGATIAKYTIKVGGTEYTTTSSSITSNVLTVAGEYAIVVTATDTRGNVSAAYNDTINVLAYESPEITGSVFRSDSNGNPAPTTGDCIRLQLGETHTNIGNNSVTWQSISYVKGNSSTSISVPTSQIPITLTQDGNTTGFSASDKYVFTVVIQDSVGTSKTAIFTVPSAFMLLHFNKNGHGMAIGGGNVVDRTIQTHLPLRTKYGITYDNGGGFYDSTNNVEGHKINPARLADANLPSTGITGMNHFLATNSMSTGKPATDGHIINCSWDWTDNLSTTGNYDSQLFIPNAQSGHMAFRAQGGRAWSGNNWITVLDENNWSNYITIPKSKYVSGDKFEIVDGDSLGLQIPGIVTTSTQLVHVELHMPYSMENVTPSISALKGYIRGVSGYLDNTGSTNQNYITSSSVTVTCTKITNYILRINITKSGNGTWSNTTNNTPVSLQANSITINFT